VELTGGNVLADILATDDAKNINTILTGKRIKLTAENPTTTVTVTGQEKLEAPHLDEAVMETITADERENINTWLNLEDVDEKSDAEIATAIDNAIQEKARNELDIVQKPDDGSETEQPAIVAAKTYDVTYTNADGVEQNKGFEKGYLDITLDFPEDEKPTTYDGNYIVAHLVMHSGTSKDGQIEYLKPYKVDAAGLHVRVTSLSLFTAIKTDTEVVSDLITNTDNLYGEVPDDGVTPSITVAAPADNTGMIVLVGAVAATAVVGGVVAYNWDKLPVHKIEGTVVDANGVAIANATVTIAKEGKVVKTLTTDENGHYEAKVAKGEYTITATVGEASTTAEGSTGTAAQLKIA
jgi:hypothetical protein